MIRKRQRPREPGAYGNPLPLAGRDDEEKALIEKGWERQGFNEEVCKTISLHREINGQYYRWKIYPIYPIQIHFVQNVKI